MSNITANMSMRYFILIVGVICLNTIILQMMILAAASRIIDEIRKVGKK